MISLWNTILDGLTYKDIAGRRQPRAYTVITGLILLIVSMTSGLALINRLFLMSKVQASPAPVTLSPEIVPRMEVAPTEKPKTTISTGCPTNPDEWSLVPVYNSPNYNLIQPACVYQGLEKTIAWALALREGYSRAEATQQLGFTDMPMRRLDQVTIPTITGGVEEMPVSFIPSNPNFTEWRLNSNSEAAVTYALRGCFRTSTVIGNRVDVWGGDYPVVCLVVEDAENTNIIYLLDGHSYTSTATPMRSYLLFGYLKDGLWVWLGTQSNPKIEITDPKANASDLLTIATLCDSQPWGAEWLKREYHLDMQPLPEHWQTLNDENEKETILLALSTNASGDVP